jgi:hypothetical protein
VRLPKPSLVESSGRTKPGVYGGSQEPPIVTDVSARQSLFANKPDEVLFGDAQVSGGLGER